jgi:small subunit ribosomal protein S16
MLRIRLQRRGKKNYATYRVVVADQRAPIQGRYIADLGFYNPHTDIFKVEAKVVADWIAKGVKPTPTVHNLLVNNGLLKAEKVQSWRPKPKAKAETPAAA